MKRLITYFCWQSIDMYMKKILIAAGIVMLAACGGKDKKEKVEEPKPEAPLSKSKNSEAFNQSFSKLMDDYFHLKDNFITESDTLINTYAGKLAGDADSLQLGELKADSTLISTAKAMAQGISADLKGLLGEKDIEAKRKSFQMISEQVYDLVRVVQYDREVVYHQHCPMAFDNAGANWLSRSTDVRNPYLPKKMLTCGEVTDSLDFRPKQ